MPSSQNCILQVMGVFFCCAIKLVRKVAVCLGRRRPLIEPCVTLPAGDETRTLLIVAYEHVGDLFTGRNVYFYKS